ncbi:MAG: dihydroorotate dehydrogenase electron transfer subunit [Sedimentisphaerales bacterium]|nr:dihydroorotate dehydrogenase electron transfer subunit [Sedimentisphaerales bacterium]
MTQTRASSEKGSYVATVLSNRRIGECFWKMRLRFAGSGARAFGGFRAGQFFQIDVGEVALPPLDAIPAHLRDGAHRHVLLRRPFSFAEVTVGPDLTDGELLYCVVGPATLRMTTLAEGDSVGITGPLGKGFWVPDNKKTALLVAGGMGLPPISCLAKTLAAEYPDIEAIAFLGAKTARALPIEGRLDQTPGQSTYAVPIFAQSGIPSILATDDGSMGFKGTVVERLGQWLHEQGADSRNERIIYACGPEPMLAAVAGFAREHDIDCQVSMERRMACGIGLCQSCAVECCAEGSNGTVYRLCCKDGPVFDARDVVFDV